MIKRNNIFLIIRVFVAVVLLLLLYYSGRLDFSVFARINPTLLLLTFPFYLIAFLVGIHRWRMLLHGIKIPISLWDTTRLAMTGIWVSSVLPGGALFAGDVTRATFIASKNYSNQRAIAIMSVLMDRLLGMFAIFVIAAVALLMSTQLLMKSVWLQLIAVILISLIITFLVVIALAFSQRTHNWIISLRFIKKIPGYNLFMKVFEAFYAFRKHPKILLRCHLISYIGHGAMILAIYILSIGLGIRLDSVSEYFFAIPVGLISSMLPISGPAGIGVGNVGFDVTFRLVNSNYGAELAILWQATFIIASQLGLVFFLIGRKKQDVFESPATGNIKEI
jgi:uncharacterized protein (TIRG00374 family)